MYPIIMKFVQRFGLSTVALERKAAVKVLGYLSDPDSCLEMIKENIEDVTKFIVQRLQDPSVSIAYDFKPYSLSWEKRRLKLWGNSLNTLYLISLTCMNKWCHAWSTSSRSWLQLMTLPRKKVCLHFMNSLTIFMKISSCTWMSQYSCSWDSWRTPATQGTCAIGLSWPLDLLNHLLKRRFCLIKKLF